VAAEEKDEDGLPITGSEIGLVVKGAGWVRRAFRRPPPAAVLTLRAKVRKEIRENLAWPEHDPAPEVLIVKHNKYDDYGKIDQRILARGASDWFKAEVKAIHDRGLEVFSAIEYVIIRRGKAWRVRDNSHPGARKVWFVGRIPYERIVYMDWEPDPYYSSPRFYVKYTWARNPTREVVLYEGEPDKYLYEMDGLKYKGEGGGPIKRFKRLKQNVAFSIQDRRQSRQRWKNEA
jgi:hypothetical protein